MASPRNDSKTVLVTGPVTLYEASAVRETLRLAMADGKRLRIDLSDSGPWDLAGLQLMISCVKTAKNRDRPVKLINIPKECAEIARRSGLAEWLAQTSE